MNVLKRRELKDLRTLSGYSTTTLYVKINIKKDVPNQTKTN